MGLVVAAMVIGLSGCAGGPSVQSDRPSETRLVRHEVAAPVPSGSAVTFASGQFALESGKASDADAEQAVSLMTALAGPASLREYEAFALENNPSLQRLQQEVNAAWAKVTYLDALPDPTVAANVFGDPIETAAGSQRANLKVAQMIPWLERLDAQAQQASCEALALQESLRRQQLEVLAEVRTSWYRLFVLSKQIETTRTRQALLESLIQVATARVATGMTSQSDVSLGTLELSRLEEAVVRFKQQTASTKTRLNRWVGIDVRSHVTTPVTVQAELPDWTADTLSELALTSQPAIQVARLKAQATLWGVEVARLRRRPDVSVNASWFIVDDNRPTAAPVQVGEDAWALGAQVSLPLDRQKYDAQEDEAAWRHHAAHAVVEEVTLETEARIRDLWEQARATDQTLRLYRTTILPQARQTLDADQKSYGNGSVGFDRVMESFRNVLALEEAQFRLVGQLATILARIERTVGHPLDVPPTDTDDETPRDLTDASNG